MKNFLAEINERTRSPLIYSFLIAWVIFNWKIPVSLLFEDVKELEAHGYYSHLQFIQAKLNWSKGLVHPLLSSVIYTFVFPFVRNGISIFNAWINRWGSHYTLNISKKGKISLEKYIDIKKELDYQLSNLEQTIIKEASYLKENTQLKKDIDLLKDDFENISKSRNPILIDGFWRYEYPVSANSRQIGYLRIEKGYIFKTDGSKRYETTIISKIALFNFQNHNNNIQMVSMPSSSNLDPKHIILNGIQYFDLQISPERHLLEGKFGPNLENIVTLTKFE